MERKGRGKSGKHGRAKSFHAQFTKHFFETFNLIFESMFNFNGMNEDKGLARL